MTTKLNGTPNAVNRYDIIDLLRGVAILLVVILHVRIRIPFNQTDLLEGLPKQIYSAIFTSGGEGVRIFFVISGFIITMTTLRRFSSLNKIDLVTFYTFRFARIMPCLIALLVVLSGLHFLGVQDYVIGSKFSYSEALFSALTFHLNWLEGMKGYLPGNWDVLWSLSVEEVFYIFFPLMCIFIPRKNFLYFVLLTIIIIGPFYRWSLEGNSIWQTKAYLSCMDSIAFGCLFALISHEKTISQSLLRWLSIAGSAIVVFVLLTKRDSFYTLLHDTYIFQSLLSLGVGFLLIVAVRDQLKPFTRTLMSPLIAYGRLSYEIYLTHMFVVYSGIRLYKKYNVDLNDSFYWLAGILIISGILGYLVERFFSKPMNHLIRKKWLPAK